MQDGDVVPETWHATLLHKSIFLAITSELRFSRCRCVHVNECVFESLYVHVCV